MRWIICSIYESVCPPSWRKEYVFHVSAINYRFIVHLKNRQAIQPNTALRLNQITVHDISTKVFYSTLYSFINVLYSSVCVCAYVRVFVCMDEWHFFALRLITFKCNWPNPKRNQRHKKKSNVVSDFFWNQRFDY